MQLDIIAQGVHDLEKQINGFQAQKDSKEYKHLDEMLTRHLVALDVIDSNGNQEIRQQRKAVIELVNGCIKSLESKAIENSVSNSPSTNTNQVGTLKSLIHKINALFVLNIFDSFHSWQNMSQIQKDDVNKRELRYTIKGTFLVSS